MNNQTLIIYKFTNLYQVLKEVESELNFKIIEYLDEKTLKNEIKNIKNYLIITKQKLLGFDNQYVAQQFPITLNKLVEKLNINILRQQFSNQSKLNINNYLIDLNSRELLLKNLRLKLTEKEISIILYLSKIKTPVSINELQKHVWMYQNDIETHTVETHIYRLRKKILKTFKDKNFIMSKKMAIKLNKKNPIAKELRTKKFKSKVIKPKKERVVLLENKEIN